MQKWKNEKGWELSATTDDLSVARLQEERLRPFVAEVRTVKANGSHAVGFVVEFRRRELESKNGPL